MMVFHFLLNIFHFLNTTTFVANLYWDKSLFKRLLDLRFTVTLLSEFNTNLITQNIGIGRQRRKQYYDSFTFRPKYDIFALEQAVRLIKIFKLFFNQLAMFLQVSRQVNLTFSRQVTKPSQKTWMTSDIEKVSIYFWVNSFFTNLF